MYKTAKITSRQMGGIIYIGQTEKWYTYITFMVDLIQEKKCRLSEAFLLYIKLFHAVGNKMDEHTDKRVKENRHNSVQTQMTMNSG